MGVDEDSVNVGGVWAIIDTGCDEGLGGNGGCVGSVDDEVVAGTSDDGSSGAGSEVVCVVFGISYGKLSADGPSCIAFDDCLCGAADS